MATDGRTFARPAIACPVMTEISLCVLKLMCYNGAFSHKDLTMGHTAEVLI